MKRWQLALIVVPVGIALFTVLAILVFRGITRANYLSYIERITGITLPSRPHQVDIYDNTEYFVVTHLTIPNGVQTEAFADRYGFEATPVEIGEWLVFLKPENRSIPTDADLRFLEGSNENNRWLCAFDRTTGRLWIVIFYPDPGGLGP